MARKRKNQLKEDLRELLLDLLTPRKILIAQEFVRRCEEDLTTLPGDQKMEKGLPIMRQLVIDLFT